MFKFTRLKEDFLSSAQSLNTELWERLRNSADMRDRKKAGIVQSFIERAEKVTNEIKKYDIPEAVVSAVAEHHEDKPFSSVVSRIVWVADAISGSRPGARYEPHETYVKRLQQIEDLSKAFPGVAEVYAFQAGRDVRVIVKPEMISDAEMTILVAKIRQQLEKQAQYVGQIKITAVREVRVTDITKAK